ncbi:MAG: prepilin peptidase [Phycisphaerales bacterium]|nr:prepilin peptidase [Phycisphaerales bacterium]
MGLLAATDGLVMVLGHGPWLLFTLCLGASVGSFVNVIVYRLPLGMSLVSPPSRCPTCGGRLRFFRENLPVLGWLVLKGRCRFCKSRISPVYPIVELAMGLLFMGLYVVLFMSQPDWSWWWEVSGTWWNRHGFALAWPGYLAIAFMLAGLWAMTVIDARTFLIPIQIPTFMAVSAMVLWLLQGLIAHQWGPSWAIPATGWAWSLASICALGGALISTGLTAAGLWRHSFADYEAYVPEGETLADYPHARREMGIELRFVGPILVGFALGWWWGGSLEGTPPIWLQALGGSVTGWLAGGAAIWAVRILGTLGFGREAMGMGDVHLLAAVGAALGWFLPLVAFFVAPFLGLAWAAAAALLSRMDGRRRELPYGPHLAVAVVAVFCCRGLVMDAWHLLVPRVDPPARSLVLPDSHSGPSAHWTPVPESGSMLPARDGDRAAIQMPGRRLSRWL